MKEIKSKVQFWWGNTPLNIDSVEEVLLKNEDTWQHKIR